MKSATRLTLLGIICAALVITGCAKKRFTSWKYFQDPALAEQLKSFVAEKEAEANADTNPVPPGAKSFFAAAREGNCPIRSLPEFEQLIQNEMIKSATTSERH